MVRQLFVIIDINGDIVKEAGAPFDGLTIQDAELEARDTLIFQPDWHLVPINRRLELELEKLSENIDE